MSPERFEVSPGQGSLDFDNPEEPFHFEAPEVPPADVPEEGPSVNLVGYYSALRKALGYFAKENKGTNYRNRFHEGSPIIGIQFADRYPDPNQKFDESEESRDRLEDLARKEFAKAFGHEALVASGIKTESAINISMERYFNEFGAQYRGIPNKKARGSLQGKLDRRIKRLEARKDDKS